MQVRADDLMDLLVGVADPAVDLLKRRRPGFEI